MRNDIAGVVAAAADRRRLIYQGAFGTADLATNRPMTLDALFRIASMTKPVTSTAAMQLVERGLLSLDDPAEKYLPQLAKAFVFETFDPASGEYKLRPSARPVTIRHLFTHTSGLAYNFTSPIVRDFTPRAGENYPVGPLLFDPGERWHYGTSTDWLGRVVEAVSGRPLEAIFAKIFLSRWEWPNTFYHVPQQKTGRVVTVNRRLPDGTIIVDGFQPPIDGFTPTGGGGLSSTAADYIRFTQTLLNGGELGGQKILRPDTVAMMAKNQIGALGVAALKTAMPERSNDFSFVADGRDKWGLGFLLTTDPVAGKRSSGSLSWGGIFNTYFWVDQARGVSGVILMQFLPFADGKALAVYDAFERGVYRLAQAEL